MNWFDIIKIDDVFETQSGKFPGSTSQAIAEALSTDNINIVFDEEISAFKLTVSHPKFGEIYTIDERSGSARIHNMHYLNVYLSQAKKYIGFIDRIFETFTNNIEWYNTQPVDENQGVEIRLKFKIPDREKEKVKFKDVPVSLFLHNYPSDPDIGFRFSSDEMGRGWYFSDWEWLSFNTTEKVKWPYLLKKLKEFLKKVTGK